jgi:hypothetical protein
VSANIQDHVPDHFPAGTTVKFTRSLDDYLPSDGWSYTIYLNGLTQKFSKASAVDSNQFLVEFLPSDTASLVPGPYRYAERLSNPGTQFVITGVTIDGLGNAIYAFSSFTNLPPFLGMQVAVTGFSNGGNNASGAIAAMELDGNQAGTFTIPNGAAVNETHAAAGAGPAEVHDLRGDELVINIEPNVSIAAAGAFATFEEQQLAVIEAVLAGRITSGIESYQIAGRSVTKIPIPDLMKMRGMLRAAVWRQDNPGKLGVPYKVEFPNENEDRDLPPTWVDVTGLER